MRARMRPRAAVMRWLFFPPVSGGSTESASPVEAEAAADLLLLMMKRIDVEALARPGESVRRDHHVTRLDDRIDLFAFCQSEPLG